MSSVRTKITFEVTVEFGPCGDEWTVEQLRRSVMRDAGATAGRAIEAARKERIAMRVLSISDEIEVCVSPRSTR